MKLYIWTSLAGASSAWKDLLSTPPHGDHLGRGTQPRVFHCLRYIHLVQEERRHIIVSARREMIARQDDNAGQMHGVTFQHVMDREKG